MAKVLPKRYHDAERDSDRTWTVEDFADLFDLRTRFGRLAAAARAEYLNSGGTLLDRDGIEREVADRRGGVDELVDR